MKLDKEHVLIANIVVFSAVALMHFARLILGIEVVAGGYSIPFWLSSVCVIVLAWLVWQNWRFTEGSKVTCAKVITGIVAVDLAGIMFFWLQEIRSFGFQGSDYAIPAVIDLIVITGLVWYITKE